MKEHLERIMELQRAWSSKNTSEMSERGQIVRHGCPTWLSTYEDSLSRELGLAAGDLLVEGGDGAGRKSEIPWVRFGSRERSPRPTEGWYCVYLFAATGDHVYLALGRGSTVWNGAEFRARPTSELHALAEWARATVSPLISAREDIQLSLDLGARKSHLGSAYEASTAVCIRYSRGRVPDDTQLRRDAVFFAQLLGKLYQAESTSPVPGAPAAEVVDVLVASAEAAGKVVRGRGQGFRPSLVQRQAIEERAMVVAREYLETEKKWRVQDKSRTESFDYLCEHDNETIYVEVKGTTSNGESIVLTRSEVEHHRSVFPRNGLAVVRRIELNGDVATGGDIEFIAPWDIQDTQLRIVSYLYEVPTESD